MTDANAIIALLGLTAHPEGGWFRETFRDTTPIADGRGASTAIYFLLKQGERSHWHRIDAAEVWHWYAGAPLELRIGAAGGETLVLGPALETGARPQAVVPPGAWQSARSLGDYTLVGCTVAPAFAFEHFELAPSDFDGTARG
jgi:predicted cupin superfamily sugar epimerase